MSAACSNDLGYSLQAPRKRYEGTAHPDRNDQFEHINTTADRFLQRGQPVISVDTKKKELVGNFKNGGREWQPKGSIGVPYAFTISRPTRAARRSPMVSRTWLANEAWVSCWARIMTRPPLPSRRFATGGSGWAAAAYPTATDLFITADAGGSNGYRVRAWKLALQQWRR